MPLIFFALMVSAASANWSSAWLKPAEIQWQGAKTSSAEVGISVFCGFAGFSKRTRLFVTIENRSAAVSCLRPKELLKPSIENIQRLQERLPAIRGRLARAVLRSHILTKTKYEAPINVKFSCRHLEAAQTQLPDFAAETDPVCAQDLVQLKPEEIFEISYSFSAPLEPMVDFVFTPPGECQGKAPQKLHLRCQK